MALDAEMRGKSGVITGGLRGIGFAIARALAAEGVNLTVADIEPDDTALEQLRNAGVSIHFVQTDVARESEVIDLVRNAETEMGGIDLFVNNAARAFHEPVTRVTSDAFFASLNTNLASCVWACREISRSMIDRRRGSILIVGSTVRICPAYTEASYRISKTGLKMYLETLAIELAPFGIRANMLTPGHHVTRLTAGISPQREQKVKQEIPMRRFGDPA